MGVPAISRRFRLVACHLLLSGILATLIGTLVFQRWYPPPFAVMAGADRLFKLLIGVDLVLGPALTLLVASPKKSNSNLFRDLAFVALAQAAALGYGVRAAALGRPVVLVFEVDLFRLLSAADVDTEMLAKAPAELRSLSWTGPIVIAVKKPDEPRRQLETIDLAVAGIPLAALPEYWEPYASQADAAWRASGAVPQHIGPTVPAPTTNPDGFANSEWRCIPIVSRYGEWFAMVALPGASVRGYATLTRPD